MKRRRLTPLLAQVLEKIAPRIGARVLLEPEWGIVGQIIFKNGRRRHFRHSTIDLNTSGSSEISKDKDYANFFMEQMGYPTVPGTRKFYSDAFGRAIGRPRQTLVAAARYAKQLGFPVVVKPNSGTQGGGVALVRNRREFVRAMRAIFKRDRVALVQRRLTGKDYRLVVLDRKVISAYERVPLSVRGDGRSTIADLLERKQRRFVREGRDTRIDLADPRIGEKLKSQGLDLRSVPRAAEVIFLLDNANLSTGGDSIDVTGDLHAGFRRLAVNLTRDMGLRMCGVDLMVDGDIRQAPRPGTFWILETNAAPGLDHYYKSGKAQERIVEELYLQVLRSMSRAL